jgi:hypothetical protein
MGARGQTSQFGDRVGVRFRKQSETEIRILAALWKVSMAEVVRILTSEALVSRRKELL